MITLKNFVFLSALCQNDTLIFIIDYRLFVVDS